MPLQTNRAGFFHARSLVKSLLTDKEDNTASLTLEQKAKYMEEFKPIGYAQWFLGVDKAAASSGNPSAYGFPFTNDFKTVSRKAVIAARDGARESGAEDIEFAATILLNLIDGDREAIASCEAELDRYDVPADFSISVSDKISNRVRT
jgi:hypothetical protein